MTFLQHNLLHRRSFLETSLSFSALLAAGCGGTSSEGSQDTLTQEWCKIDLAGRTLVSDGYTPGLSISVMREGKFLYSKAFGFSNLETQTVMDVDSIFKVASITKQMTSAAILLLQEDGKLSVYDKLSKYIPTFPRADEITLYQLATHTAGLGTFNRLDTRHIDRLREYNDDEYLKLMKRTDPIFIADPGQSENYSNTDYGLLGIVIGRVSDIHYSEFFQRRLFDPIGLEKTQVDDFTKVIPKRVSGYYSNSKQASGYERAAYTSSSYPGPAGAVISTSEDLCKWHKALVFGNLLKPESWKQMIAPVRLPADVSYYGMGVRSKFSRKPFEGRNVVSHGGRIHGFATDLWSFPEKGVTVATLLNTSGGDKDDFGKRFDGLRDPATQMALNEYT